MEYHERWTSVKYLTEEYRYKIGESSRANNRECEVKGIKASDNDYDEKRAGAVDVAWEKFFAAIFHLGAYRCQYGGMMTQLRKNYSKGQQTYPETVQKEQVLLTVWEGVKYPVHGSNEGLSLSSVVNGNDGDKGAAGDRNTQASGGCASHGGATETYHCY